MNRKYARFKPLVLSILLSVCGSCLPAGIPPGRDASQWVHLEPGDRISSGGFELFLKKETGSNCTLYLKSTPGEPYLFLTSEIRMSADVLVSPHHRYLLINAPCSDVARCVYSTDARSGMTRMISGGVRRAYQEAASPNASGGPASGHYPVGAAFSPDETMALLRIGPDPPPVAGSIPIQSDRRSYVVKISDGSVLKEYRTESLPDHWWELNRSSPEGFY